MKALALLLNSASSTFQTVLANSPTGGRNYMRHTTGGLAIFSPRGAHVRGATIWLVIIEDVGFVIDPGAWFWPADHMETISLGLHSWPAFLNPERGARES